MTATVDRSTPGRLERRKAKTRASILQAASSLFHAQGFEATSIQQIAERADTGVGTLYGYFASKDDILREVLRHHSAEAVARYNDAVRTDTPALERVMTALRTFAEYIEEHRTVLLAAFQIGARSRERQPSATEEGDWLIRAFESIIRDGIAAGTVQPLPVDATARLLIGTYLQAMLRIGVWQDVDDTAAAQRDLELLARQLLTPRP